MSIARKVMEEPGKYSIQQLQQAMENGVLPAYIAIPLIQEKTQLQKQFQQQQAMQQEQPESTIADQIMQEADQMGGVAQLPSYLPEEYAGGGIVAFGGGGEVQRYQNEGLVSLGPGSGGLSPEEIAYILEQEQQMKQEYGQPSSAATPFGRLFGNAGRISSEQEAQLEADRLRKQLIKQLAPKAGIRGWFTEQSDEQQKASKDIINNVNAMTLDQLKAAAAQTDPVAALEAASAAKPVPTAKSMTGREDMFSANREMTGAAPKAGPAPSAAPGVGFESVKRPFIPSAKEEAIQGLYGTEQQPGLVAKMNERAREREAFLQKAEGMVTGKAYEGLEASLRKEAEEFGADKEQAKYMAIFKAGLAMMAGTSQHALENIGKGAMVGAEDYQKAAADIKKAKKENDRMMAYIEQARRAEDAGKRDRAIANYDKAEASKQKVDELVFSSITNAGIKDADRKFEEYKLDRELANRRQIAQMAQEGKIDAVVARALLSGAGRGQVSFSDRMQAMKMVNPDLIRQQVLKEQKLSTEPKSKEALTAYNRRYDELYEEELNKIISRASGMGMGAGSTVAGPQMSLVGKRPDQ